MSEIFGTLKGFFTKANYGKIVVDNFVFRVHYRLTATLLVIFGILVTSHQYIGDPIDCIIQHNQADKIVDQFCWVHGTYTKLDISKDSVIGYKKEPTLEDDVDYLRKKQKLDESKRRKDPPRETKKLEDEFFNFQKANPDERLFHTYYQWVWAFLFFQAFLFYLPHWLWKNWEAGRMNTFVGDLRSFKISAEEKKKHQDAVVEYFCGEGHGRFLLFRWKSRGNHTLYAIKYFFCEVLNLVNICCQLALLDNFFGKHFSTYGTKVWEMTGSRPYARNDEMTKIFPIVTMCDLPIPGYNHQTVVHGAMCVLPLNILNEKIFLFIWFWFLAVLTLTTMGVCYRILTLVPSTPIRKMLLFRLHHAMPERSVHTLCSKLGFGDWFFLYLLGKNMNPIYYTELLSTLANRFSDGHCDEDNHHLTPETPMGEWSNGEFRKRPIDS